MNDLTKMLERVEKGEGSAAAELLPLVYEELRKLAAARMAQEAAGHTLQPTALVHEAIGVTNDRHVGTKFEATEHDPGGFGHSGPHCRDD